MENWCGTNWFMTASRGCSTALVMLGLTVLDAAVLESCQLAWQSGQKRSFIPKSGLRLSRTLTLAILIGRNFKKIKSGLSKIPTSIGVSAEWREDKRHLGVILRTVSVWCGAHLMTRFGKELIVFWAAFSSARFAAIGTQWDQIGGYST